MKSLRKSREVATLIATLMQRSKKTKAARIANSTFCELAGRTFIDKRFFSQVQSDLEEIGIIILKLEDIDDGSYGLTLLSSIEKAPILATKKHLDLLALDQDFNALWDNLSDEPGFKATHGNFDDHLCECPVIQI